MTAPDTTPPAEPPSPKAVAPAWHLPDNTACHETPPPVEAAPDEDVLPLLGVAVG